MKMEKNNFKYPDEKFEKECQLIFVALENLEKEYHFSRLNPMDFTSEQTGYSQDDISQDLNRLSVKREGYEKLSPELKIMKMKADFIERIIVIGISKFNWFGKKTESFLVSEFDDEINHIDGLVKFDVPEHVKIFRMLGLNFDVTFTNDIKNINAKIHSLKSDLDDYRIPKVKYFYDEKKQQNGLELPKVILGCDIESVDDLIKKIANNEFNVLKNNSIQEKIIFQAEAQLLQFKERYGKSSAYYKREKEDEKNKKNFDDLDLKHHMASRLFNMHSQILGFIEKAMEEKKIYHSSNDQFFSDSVHVKIMSATKDINKKQNR